MDDMNMNAPLDPMADQMADEAKEEAVEEAPVVAPADDTVAGDDDAKMDAEVAEVGDEADEEAI